MTNETFMSLSAVASQARAMARRFVEKATAVREPPESLISPEFFQSWPATLGNPPAQLIRAYWGLHDELRHEMEQQAAAEVRACASISSKFAAMASMAEALDLIADARRMESLPSPAKAAPKLRVI